MLSRSDLHPYQLKAIDFIKEQKRVGLMLDLGLGKTTSTLTALSDLLAANKFKKVLIVAPLRVANSVWHTEAKKWAHLKHLTFSICTGSEANRLAGLKTKADIYVINRENIPWLVEACGKSWPFKCVVLDESSSFKNPTAKRFKAMKKVAPATDYMILLSGTPAPSGLLDMWSQTYLLDFGKALGRTLTAYRDRFFIKDYWGYTYTIKTGAADTIHGLLQPQMMHMSAADYLELPERIDLVELVEHDPSFIKKYQQFEKDMYSVLPDGQEIEALTAATLAGKLLQWSNGATYTQDGDWSPLSNAKLDALEEIVEANPTENLLVAYNFKFDLVQLKARFPKAVVLDANPETINRWNRGEISMLLAHPASASMGLNLQAGGSVIVWYGLTWALENYLQFNGRLHRQGQTKPVRIIHLIAKDCLDERVMEVLGTKDATQKTLLRALKKS